MLVLGILEKLENEAKKMSRDQGRQSWKKREEYQVSLICQLDRGHVIGTASTKGTEWQACRLSSTDLHPGVVTPLSKLLG